MRSKLLSDDNVIDLTLDMLKATYATKVRNRNELRKTVDSD